jgi:glycosidase
MPQNPGEQNSKILVYQIFTRLFGNKTAHPKPNGKIEENGSGKFSDLSQVALKSIAEMGFSHIWLTGILRHATQTDYSVYGLLNQHPATVKGKAGSPYAIVDFFDLDPDLAKNSERRWAEFEDCCQRIHACGLKLIIDFVPNHTAREYKSPFAESQNFGTLGENDFSHEWFHPNNHYFYIPERPLQLPVLEKDKQGNYFVEYPAKATGNDCFSEKPSVYDWYETVKLNYGFNYYTRTTHFDPIPATWKYMLEVLKFWAGKNIDGFRCDMVEMVPAEFWAWAIPQIKGLQADLIFIAEVYNPDQYLPYLNYGKFDFLYDKVGLYDVLRKLVEGEGNAMEITKVWQSQEGFEHKMLRFLENHDEQRIASDLVGKDPLRSLPAFVISAMMGKGPLMVYFGQELGEKAEGAAGFSGDDGKTTIFDYWTIPSIQRWQNDGKWNEEKLTDTEKLIRQEYCKILNLARNNQVFSKGSFFDLQYANTGNSYFHLHKQFAFLRFLGKEKFLLVQSFLEYSTAVRVIIPPDAWYALNMGLEGRARLTDAFEIEMPIDFFIQVSYQSEGNAAGILMTLPAWGFRIWKINPS